MFSLRSNGLAWAAPLHPGGGRCAPFRLPPALPGGSRMTAETTPPRRGRGGRPKGDPAAVRASTIGVRVSPAEYEALRTRAAEMGMTPAQWLREAALSRCLPSPPVPAINRQEYAALARLAGNINQLSKAYAWGQPVSLNSELLGEVLAELARLRLALIGAGGKP